MSKVEGDERATPEEAERAILAVVDQVVSVLEARGVPFDELTMLAFVSLAARTSVLLGKSDKAHVEAVKAALRDARRDHG